MHKDQLIDRLCLGTEEALNRADLLNDKSIHTVQAAVLYLLALPGPSSTKWPLAGLLIRVAISIGLHRDPLHFPYVPAFEAEMRRRLWWALCLADWQFGDMQFSEMSLNESLFDTRLPCNVNDGDLFSGMAYAPVAQTGVTDSTCFLIQCESWLLKQRLQLVTARSAAEDSRRSPSEQAEMLYDMSSEIRSKYMHSFDPGNSLHCFVLTNFRLMQIKTQLVIHHRALFGSSGLPSELQERFFTSSIDLLEFCYSLQSDTCHDINWKKWKWLIRDYVQWHAMAFILRQLCISPWDPSREHAWNLINRVFLSIPMAARGTQLWHSLGLLLQKAHRTRENRHPSCKPIIVDAAAAAQGSSHCGWDIDLAANPSLVQEHPDRLMPDVDEAVDHVSSRPDLFVPFVSAPNIQSTPKTSSTDYSPQFEAPTLGRDRYFPANISGTTSLVPNPLVAAPAQNTNAASPVAQNLTTRMTENIRGDEQLSPEDTAMTDFSAMASRIEDSMVKSASWRDWADIFGVNML